MVPSQPFSVFSLNITSRINVNLGLYRLISGDRVCSPYQILEVTLKSCVPSEIFMSVFLSSPQYIYPYPIF